MAWPDMRDIGELARSANKVTALCVISDNEEELGPWVSAATPQILGNAGTWRQQARLDPVLVKAMERMTSMINSSNTVAAGYEKDIVVGILSALHKAGFELDGHQLQGWALTHGWTGANSDHLARFANDIAAGRRLRFQARLRPDIVDQFRAATRGEDR